MTTFLLVIVFVFISLVCIFVFIYVSIFIYNDCRVAMHFHAPCIIVLYSISVRSARICNHFFVCIFCIYIC